MVLGDGLGMGLEVMDSTLESVDVQFMSSCLENDLVC